MTTEKKKVEAPITIETKGILSPETRWICQRADAILEELKAIRRLLEERK